MVAENTIAIGEDGRTRALSTPRDAPEYDDHHKTLGALLDIRQEAGLSRGDVARRMGVNISQVASMEAALRCVRYSPSLNALQSYAEACGRRLVIRLE